jgi:hypothetical protein
VAALSPIHLMAVTNKYEAQCETSRLLCQLSKRKEIHAYICKFEIVTVLVKELLNTSYCEWTRQHAMLALSGLSDSHECQVIHSSKFINMLGILSDIFLYFSRFKVNFSLNIIIVDKIKP